MKKASFLFSLICEHFQRFYATTRGQMIYNVFILVDNIINSDNGLKKTNFSAFKCSEAEAVEQFLLLRRRFKKNEINTFRRFKQIIKLTFELCFCS